MQEMQETRVQSLGREDPLEKGKAAQSSIIAWRITWTEGRWQATVHGVAESDTTERLTLSLFYLTLNKEIEGAINSQAKLSVCVMRGGGGRGWAAWDAPRTRLG